VGFMSGGIRVAEKRRICFNSGHLHGIPTEKYDRNVMSLRRKSCRRYIFIIKFIVEVKDRVSRCMLKLVQVVQLPGRTHQVQHEILFKYHQRKFVVVCSLGKRIDCVRHIVRARYE
jgi:hypothetical protein